MLYDSAYPSAVAKGISHLARGQINVSCRMRWFRRAPQGPKRRLVERLERDWWGAFRGILETRFQQKEILIRAIEIEKL